MSELRVDYGPGYRIYFVQRGSVLAILLCGGDKQTQVQDIATAKRMAEEARMALETTVWDAANYLDSPAAELAYIEAAFEDGSPELIAAAIGDVARARRMTQIARDAGLSRETMYKAFRARKPDLSTVLGVMKALGLELHATIVKEREHA